MRAVALDLPLPRRLVLIVRGPLAVGKTTTSERLRELLAPCAVVSVDKLRRMTSDADLSQAQLELAKGNAAALAKRFLAAGYRVVIESVFERESHLRLVQDSLRRDATIRTVLLSAALETLSDRDSRKTSPNEARVEEVYGRVRSFGEDVVIATDGLDADAVADAVVSRLTALQSEEARSRPREGPR